MNKCALADQADAAVISGNHTQATILITPEERMRKRLYKKAKKNLKTNYTRYLCIYIHTSQELPTDRL